MAIEMMKYNGSKGITLKNDKFSSSDLIAIIIAMISFFLMFYIFSRFGLDVNIWSGNDWSKVEISNFNLVTYIYGIMLFTSILALFISIKSIFHDRENIVLDLDHNAIFTLYNDTIMNSVKLVNIDKIRFYVQNNDINYTVEFLNDNIIQNKLSISNAGLIQLQNYCTLPFEIADYTTGRRIFVHYDGKSDTQEPVEISNQLLFRTGGFLIAFFVIIGIVSIYLNNFI